MEYEMYQKYIKEVEKGKKLLESYYYAHLDSGSRHVVILVFPDKDNKVISAAFHNLGAFVETYGYDTVVILSSIVLPDYALTVNIPAKVCYYNIEVSDMNSVLRSTSFMEYQNVRILSVNSPFNTKAEVLIGFKDVNIDNFTNHCLLGLFGGDKSND